MARLKRVLIYCDSTPRTGLGHLVRAVSVATAARESGWEIIFTGSITTELGNKILSGAGIQPDTFFGDLGDMVIQDNISVVHIDSYEVGEEALAKVRSTGAILSSMEDGRFARRPADIVIDSSFGAEVSGSESMRRPDDGSRVILRGIKFAPLRPEVVRARAERALKKGLNHPFEIVVVMGGTDATGAIATIFSLFDNSLDSTSVTFIAPPGNWPPDAKNNENIHQVSPGADLLDYVMRADLVVSAAGTTTWELACIGVPTVIVAVTENQLAGYKANIQLGVARGLGTLEEINSNPKAAKKIINNAVFDVKEGKNWGTAGTKIVDGMGASRIVAAWEAVLGNRIVKASIAQQGDGSE